MKRFLLLFVAVICMAATTQVQAQEKGEMAAGAQFALGAGDNITNFGIGAKFQWNVINNLRLEPSFNYFFKKDYVSMWDLNANVHYQFSMGEKICLYPLAGLSVMGVSVKMPEVDLGVLGSYGGGSASDTEFGLNLGAGVDFKITEHWVVNVEAKYKIGGEWSRFIATAGFAYKF